MKYCQIISCTFTLISAQIQLAPHGKSSTLKKGDCVGWKSASGAFCCPGVGFRNLSLINYEIPGFMYDTVKLCFSAANLLETAHCLSNPKEQVVDGRHIFTGHLDNLEIRVEENKVIVNKGSLCKFYFRDNIKTLDREATKSAIECLSDALHLPMEKSQVWRIDFGTNLITKHPVCKYMPGLGVLKRSTRLEQGDGLLYKTKERCLSFYDKTAEMRIHKGSLPECFENKNILRYELRLKSHIARKLGMTGSVTAEMLYDAEFYMALLNMWHDMYMQIEKEPIITLNWVDCNGKKDFKTMCVKEHVKNVGGFHKLKEEVARARRCGELSNKCANVIIRCAKEAVGHDDAAVNDRDLIKELDRLVENAFLCSLYSQ